MRKLRTLALLSLLGCLVVSAGFAANDPTELGILKARMDFGNRPGRDRLILKAAFDPSLLTTGLTPANSALVVRIGPDTVLSLPAPDDRGKMRVKRDRIYRYVRKATRQHPDSLKLRIDVVKGVMKLTAERIDLSDVRGLGAEEVSFSLTIAGATFGKTLEMGVKEQRWRYRYTGKGHGVGGGLPGGIGGGGGLPGGGGGGGAALSFRTLKQGSFSGSSTLQAMVLRSQQAYTTEWMKRFPPPPPGMGMPVSSPPPVDFATEMVVVIDLGGRASAGYTIDVTKVTESGTGVIVSWQETRPGANCVVATVVTNPFVFAAVTRRDGTVSFTGSTVTKNCP